MIDKSYEVVKYSLDKIGDVEAAIIDSPIDSDWLVDTEGDLYIVYILEDKLLSLGKKYLIAHAEKKKVNDYHEICQEK